VSDICSIFYSIKKSAVFVASDITLQGHPRSSQTTWFDGHYFLLRFNSCEKTMTIKPSDVKEFQW